MKLVNKRCIYALTRHAAVRCQQRGVRKEVVDLVLANFDRDHHAGAGVVAISISKPRLQILQSEGHLIALLERAARIVLLVAESGAIVTVIKRSTSHARSRYGAGRPHPWRWSLSRHHQSRKSQRDA